MNKLSIVKEMFGFLLNNKKFWLIPIVVAFLLLGLLLITAQSTPVAPFIYTMF